MDTLMQFKIWGDTPAASELNAMLREMEQEWSVTLSDSELSRLNHDGETTLSELTAELLSEAVSLSARTDGSFDPTVYPLVKCWGFTESAYRVPSAPELQALLPYVGIDKVTLSGKEVALADGVALDFGGIAKGFAAEKLAERLEAANTPALLILGGNIQTVGNKPDGTPWSIGISDPNAPEQSAATITFHGSMALVTSGGYQRYFEADGILYHHIIDPKTGYPVDNSLASVTILAKSGTLADAFSTALYVMGFDEGVRFWQESDDFEVVWILKNGKIIATEGAAPLLSDCSFEVVER